VVGIIVATVMYLKKNTKPDTMEAALKPLYNASYNKFWFDEVWMFATKQIVFARISKPIAWFDRHIIDGFMNALASVTNWTSRKIKVVQSGEIQDYALAFFVGALVIAALVIFL